MHPLQTRRTRDFRPPILQIHLHDKGAQLNTINFTYGNRGNTLVPGVQRKKSLVMVHRGLVALEGTKCKDFLIDGTIATMVIIQDEELLQSYVQRRVEARAFMSFIKLILIRVQ
jgi:hypothetical protein